ncbi:hypothetical protein RvY_12738-2 [Ramazzottius varieornatus]|uniref:Ryanodine receptor n=1 Tax=Ramazzottius varieornatus TaxID=947166 RepID=A0A1D1VKJ5_RAMVA|nr:hypothetical protein RvY_12738-2 [Ramazzottius varieornatus]
MGDHAESEAVSSEQDDVSFLRTNDVVCLSCTQTAKDGGSGTERVCLGAEGFGNRYCFLETVSDKNYPPDVASCMLVIEQALSIRALQEMVAAAGNEAGSQSGHRTLLYGHAVLLRHVNSDMYLTTLDTSSSSDKLAFDVGLRETAQGEACWWTIHPASKQRSEGEKVRVGDDLILVSVSTERYLHTLRTPESSVIASFHQTQWTILPVATGSIKAKSISFVFSQEIIRFFHGQDECITIPETWADHPQHNHVVYEGGDALERARSLWRVELVKGKWTGAFLNWKQPFRIVHITTGRYMSVKEGGTVSLVGRDKAKLDETAFFLKANKDDKSFGLDDKEKEEEGMGPANIKYGDTFFYIQHATSGLWLSYQSNEVTKRGVGKVEEKIAVMLEEGHMDDTLTFSRAQQEESKSARVIRKCTYLFSKFNNGLDALLRQPVDRRTSMSSAVPSSYNLKEVVDLLKDLIDYFAQPVHGTGHEAKQTHLRALKNRQDLFQQEGVLTLVLDTIDKISGLANSGYMNSLQSEDGANEALLWEEISSFLYLLIAAMIKGNHGNCAQFAQSARLNWLFSRLTQQGSEGVLDVLQSVLTDSPEALNMIREDHIRGIISLLDRSGRDHKILDILGNFCVGNGLAVRSSQNNICEFLLPGKDLLLQTKLVDHVSSVHPNIYVGFTDGSAMFRKWYYEAIIDHVELASNLPPHIRVGWANTDGYYPYPGGGERWGGNGVGDDMFSFGFDGTNIWTGGQSRAVRMYETDFGFHKGDIVGCNIDLTIPEISFSLNGVRLRATIRNFNTTGMFYPVISMSARTSCRFMLGGDQGRLKHGPPSGFSSVIESLPPKETLRIEPNFYFGEIQRSLLAGPAVAQENSTFVPKPIDTTGVNLPNYILQIRDKLAENIHELWSVMKIEAGWTYGDVRDDHLKTNPCLTNFKNLPIAEKNYDMTLSMETLKVLLALGYHISMTPTDNRIRPMKLSSTYTQPNGYKPAPLDLTNIQLTGPMEELKELLAENIHTVWAKNRIDQGWTYGLSQQNVAKRSPHLVPYDSVEDSIKEMNRNTATEVVRTLIAYGYGIDPPSGEQKVPTKAAQKQSSDKLQSRSYRAEKTYAVTEGKWYYEFEVLTPGYMKVGWALVGCLPSVELGVDDQSYAFDGSLGRKWHQGSEPFGKSWQTGDVVGCLLDLNDHTISFTINGELLVDPSGNEAAFEGVVAETEGFVPACTLGGGQRARFNFGQDIHSLKFFTTSGLQEGYEPFCVNMTRPVPFWYNRDQSVFVPVSDTNSMLEVIRIPGSGNTPAGLKLSRKSQGLTDNTQMEFLRLSLPVTTRSHYMSYEEKHQQMVQVEEARRMQKSTAATVQQRNKMEEQMITGGFSVNDIQGLTAQDRFSREQSEDTMDAMMGDMVDEAPRISARMSLSAAPRASLGVDKNQRQRGIMKKTQSLEVAESPDEPGTSGGVTFMQPLSNKRMPRSASEDRFGPNAPGPDGKLKKRSASPFSYITKKIKEAKHRSVSKERLDKTTLPGGLRTPDITLAAGKSGGPSISLRIPDQQQSFESGDMVGNGMNSQHVAFGFDNEAVRPSSTDSRYEADMDVANSNLFDLISEYNYSVRIFPGQEAKQVYMGWVTPDFHHAERPFSMESIRRAEVKVLDVGGQLKDHCFFQNSYLVSAGELQEQATSQGVQEKGRGSSTPGIVISSSIDVATGLLSFSFNGTEIEDRYQVEPGTKLFPVVFVEPTSRDVVQFEFNGTKTALPLSSALFHRDHSMVSQCPPRLRVLTLQPYHWSRVPSQALRVHELKMSDVRGWSMLCDNPVSMLAVYLPEEDRCIDVLELIENEELLQFHARTLALYSSICSHGNHKVAHALVNHVDQKQLLFAIQSPYLSGALRQAFHDLLVALHLDFHAKAMFNTRDEFVIPVKKRVDGRKGGRGGLMRQQSSINPAQCTSLRPLLNIRDKISSAGEDQVDIKNMTAPSFPLSTLKTHIMDALADGVQKGTSHSRDPIGGTYENFFVPLLKIVDQLLLIGFLNQDDMDRLLNMLDPTKFTSQIHNGLNGRGLVHMQLDENVKLQLCYVLQDLCDDRIRKRIEELVAFSEEYVGKAQADQLHRYVEIKQEDLPASIAAKKTKEFRCPPKEQMKMLLAFKNVEEEESASCPSPEEVRAELTDYHSALVARLGPQPEEKVTRFTRSFGFSNEVLTDMIKQSIIRWAAESQIESQDLIKEMFSLMHRQYDGIGEMLNAMKKAYVISTANVTDVTNMFTSLVRIRTLLSVQMGPDEEEVLRYSLW